MSPALLSVLILVPTALVVVALFVVMWVERPSARDAWIAVAGGTVLAVWASAAAMLAVRGVFVQPEAPTAPRLEFTSSWSWRSRASCLLGGSLSP
jgi:hypothetical protein